VGLNEKDGLALLAALEGLPFLRPACNDKLVTGGAVIAFDLRRDATVYVAHDSRCPNRPNWLAGFSDAGLTVVVNNTALQLWARDFRAGRVVLGDNVDPGVKVDPSKLVMYLVVVRPKGVAGALVAPPAVAAVNPPSVHEESSSTSQGLPPAPRLDASRFTFYRAINLNGPGATIDGIPWESSAEAPNCLVFGKPYSNPAAALEPAVDGEKLHMLRTAVTSSETASLILGRMPPGTYNVFLYAWSDGSSARFSIVIKGQTVAPNLTTGGAGRWERMGPWTVEVTDGTLNLVCMGGSVNLCGIEVWRK
jgi:hypothetical protein